MENVKYEKKNDILTITVDLSLSGEVSKSGKSKVIASTKGNVKIDPEKNIYLGLNVYKTL